MKMLDAAKSKDMGEAFASTTMLAAMATLCIRFIWTYIAASTWFYTNVATPFITLAYARKSIVNKVIHHRKFALFPKNPNSRAGLFGNL